MSLARTSAVLFGGLLSKAALNLGFVASVRVSGLPTLLNALESAERDKGRGIVTVSNHISTLDDPTTWGVLPLRCYLSERKTRWCLGAHDILFTNPFFSAFFSAGQVLDTVRGAGVHQPAVDRAIQLLDTGAWIHLFGEGKVVQPRQYAEDEKEGKARLIRFKWGVGRIIMESRRPPLVIPMWITGFDKLMPEGRKFPFKFFPRPRQHISVTFGEPIPADRLRAALDAPPPAASVPEVEGTPHDVNLEPDAHRAAYRPMPWLVPSPSASTSPPSSPGRAAFPAQTPFALSQTSTEPVSEKVKSTDPDPALAKHTRRVRAALTAIIQEEVEALGRRVSGVWLGKR